MRISTFSALALLCSSILLPTFAQAQANAWPENWTVLPPGPDNTVFSLVDVPRSDSLELQVRTDNDAGSLLINRDIPLTEQTTLQWRWKVNDLPSAVAENTDQTHDYFAVAVHFDNDQILSYIWSTELAEGTVFACPLPNWTNRETHIVLHSEKSRLGQWLSEEQHLIADYRRYKTGELPVSIRQIWVIAGSRSQGGSGSMEITDITVGNSQQEREKILQASADDETAK